MLRRAPPPTHAAARHLPSLHIVPPSRSGDWLSSLTRTEAGPGLGWASTVRRVRAEAGVPLWGGASKGCTSVYSPRCGVTAGSAGPGPALLCIPPSGLTASSVVSHCLPPDSFATVKEKCAAPARCPTPLGSGQGAGLKIRHRGPGYPGLTGGSTHPWT